MTQLSTFLSQDMVKQAGLGAFVATHLLPGAGRLLRGTAHLAKDVGLNKVAPGAYQSIRNMGLGAAKLQRSSGQFARGVQTVNGKVVRQNPWYRSMAVGTASLGMPIAALATPGLRSAVMPLADVMTNAGNALGQVQGASSEAGKQTAEQAGRDYVGQLYDSLSNNSYSDRRQFFNQPVQWGGMSQGVQELAGKAPAQGMSGLKAIWNTVTPWGSGDISPYIRQKAIEAANQR